MPQLYTELLSDAKPDEKPASRPKRRVRISAPPKEEEECGDADGMDVPMPPTVAPDLPDEGPVADEGESMQPCDPIRRVRGPRTPPKYLTEFMDTYAKDMNKLMRQRRTLLRRPRQPAVSTVPQEVFIKQPQAWDAVDSHHMQKQFINKQFPPDDKQRLEDYCRTTGEPAVPPPTQYYNGRGEPVRGPQASPPPDIKKKQAVFAQIFEV